MADGVWGLDQLEGDPVLVWVPGHGTTPLWRSGTLRLDRNPDGTVRSLQLERPNSTAICIGWGPGVIVEPAG
jgi:hypothetical protein